MKAELKEAWIEALLSGEYEQATSQLRADSPEGSRYCCLGVLCEVAHVPYTGTAEVPSRDLSERWGLCEAGEPDFSESSIQYKLTTANDSGTDFDKIAEMVRELVPVDEES